MDLLQELRSKRDELTTQIEGLMEADDFDPADEVFTRAKDDAEKLDARIKAVVEHQERKNAANAIDAVALRAVKDVEKRQAATAEPRSMGEAWVQSRAYEDYRAAPRGTSGHIKFDVERMFRAPITTGDYTDPLVGKVQIADAKPGMTLTPLLDIVPRVPVASGSVEWIFYPNTGPTAGKVTEGSAKPEAAVAPEVKTVSLDILAHWIQYTRSVFEDAPALMSYINMELRDGVLRKIEAEAVAALVADTDVPSTEYAAGGTLMEGIRLGIATVQQAGFYPNAVLLNPADYADLDLSLLGQTVVNTGTGPQIGQTYWGVRPIPSAGVTAGTAYLGDFSTGMANLMRSDVSVYTTDSHASTFTSNVLTTLAEVRAATVVHRPEALTVITEAPAA